MLPTTQSLVSSNREHRPRTIVCSLLFSCALAAGACASDGTSAPVAAGADSSTDSGSTETSAETNNGDQNVSQDQDVDDEITDGEVADDQTAPVVEVEFSDQSVTRTFPTFGGVRVDIPIDVSTVNEDDYLSIRPPDVAGRVVVARTSVTMSEVPIDGISVLNAAVESLGDVEISKTDETIELFGRTLSKYTYRSAIEPGPATGLIAAAPEFAPSNIGWAPIPNADLWLVEDETGLIVVGAIGADAATLTALEPLLAQTLGSLELTTGDLVPFDPEVPIGVPLNEPRELSPAEPTEGGAEPLLQVFAPIAAGSYQAINIPSAPMVSFDEGWFIAPNFPGFVVVIQPPFEGPGDGDISLMASVDSVGPLGIGKRSTAARTAVASLDQIADLDNIVVIDRSVTTIGGIDAESIDIEIAPDAACDDASPCIYALYGTQPGFAQFFNPGHRYRVWLMTDPTGELFAVSASIPIAEADWLDDTAQPFVEAIEW